MTNGTISAMLVGLLFWALEPSMVVTESCLQLITGQVGGGNYTYYHLSHEGDVTLSLHSIQGDVDVYVSQDSLHPTYEVDSHDLQSITCGDEKVDIPVNFKRPVGIGIYGHPSHEISHYQLCVNFLSVTDRPSYYYDYNSYLDDSEHSDKPSRTHVPFPYEKDDEEESLLWTILIGVLKVFVEVFM